MDKPILQRILELRTESGVRGNLQMYSTLLNEGYNPEEVIMWAADDLTLS